jgi:hypothetical protein
VCALRRVRSTYPRVAACERGRGVSCSVRRTGCLVVRGRRGRRRGILPCGRGFGRVEPPPGRRFADGTPADAAQKGGRVFRRKVMSPKYRRRPTKSSRCQGRPKMDPCGPRRFTAAGLCARLSTCCPPRSGAPSPPCASGPSQCRRSADCGQPELFAATAVPRHFTGNLNARLVLVYLNPKQVRSIVADPGRYLDSHSRFGEHHLGMLSPRTHRSPFGNCRDGASVSRPT